MTKSPSPEVQQQLTKLTVALENLTSELGGETIAEHYYLSLKSEQKRTQALQERSDYLEKAVFDLLEFAHSSPECPAFLNPSRWSPATAAHAHSTFREKIERILAVLPTYALLSYATSKKETNQ